MVDRKLNDASCSPSTSTHSYGPISIQSSPSGIRQDFHTVVTHD